MTSSPEPAPARFDEPPWQVWMAPAGLLLGLGLWLVSAVVIEIIAAAAGSSVAHPTPAVSLIESLLFDVAFVTAAFYFASRSGRSAPVDFGFRRVRIRVGVLAFILAGVGYYIVTAVYASLFALHGTDKLPSELGIHRSTAALIGAAVFVCVIAPIAEETFFRGFVFGSLRRMRVTLAGRDVGTWIAAILTGLLFGFAHAGSAAPQYLVPLGFLGFVLCLVRWRTGSLYPGMALHSFNNCLALGANELHWSAGGILGLAVAALLVLATITGPLADRGPARLPG